MSSRPEGSSYGRPRTPGDQNFGEGSTPRLQERPSSYLPSRNEGALANAESTASRYNAAFGRDLPDPETHGGSHATTQSPGGAGPTGSTPLPNPSLPSIPPPPRRRDKNGGGAGKGTLT